MRGSRRPITPRSSAAIASPPSRPPSGSRPRGSARSSTTAQPSESARWTGTAAASSGSVRVSRGSSSVPAARAPSSTSSPRASAIAVEGAPLTTAATSPACSASRIACHGSVRSPIACPQSRPSHGPSEHAGRRRRVGALDLDGEERFQLLRRELGVSAFGLNLLRLRPGQRGRIHRHERQEEVYLVLEGRSRSASRARSASCRAASWRASRPASGASSPTAAPSCSSLLALGGAEPHEGRDGVAYRDLGRHGGPPAAGGPAAARPRALMFAVRYLLPLGIFLLGCALLIVDGGGKTGWEGFFMATGAALVGAAAELAVPARRGGRPRARGRGGRARAHGAHRAAGRTRSERG